VAELPLVNKKPSVRNLLIKRAEKVKIDEKISKNRAFKG
jgi:hypothetical protein